MGELIPPFTMRSTSSISVKFRDVSYKGHFYTSLGARVGADGDGLGASASMANIPALEALEGINIHAAAEAPMALDDEYNEPPPPFEIIKVIGHMRASRAHRRLLVPCLVLALPYVLRSSSTPSAAIKYPVVSATGRQHRERTGHAGLAITSNLSICLELIELVLALAGLNGLLCFALPCSVPRFRYTLLLFLITNLLVTPVRASICACIISARILPMPYSIQ